MKLTRFIQTNMERMLEDWEEAALEIAPGLKGEDSAALRARVTRDWSDQQRGLSKKDIDELVRFNEAIDQLIANSVSSYSDRKEQDARLFGTMLKASLDPAAIFDREGKHLFINPAMADLLDAPPQDIIGKTMLELDLDFSTTMHDDIIRTVTTGETMRGEFHHSSPSGRDLDIECQFVPVFNDQNEVEAVVKNTRDITERKQTEYQVWRSANFDSLTGIPNRRLFLDRLEQILLRLNEKTATLPCSSSTWTASSKLTTNSDTKPVIGC